MTSTNVRRFRYYTAVAAVLLTSLITVGQSGASGCRSDCGVSPDDTPADVTAASKAQAKATGNWLGPVVPQAVYGGGYAR